LLSELKVKDLGIIDDMDWKLDAGFNVITGETGAGKSLIIDAIELLLTGSAGEDVIRTGASSARIEGVFTIDGGLRYAALRSFLIDRGLSFDEDTLIICCEIRKGKGVSVRINDHITTKGLLRQVGQLLVDIHGQSQHLSLLDKKYHLDFLDAFAHTITLRTEFAAGVSRLQEISAHIKSLAEQEQDRLRQEDFLKYQIEEIRNARLISGEDGELEKERHLISMSEKIKEYSSQVYQSLDGRDFGGDANSAVPCLIQAQQSLRKLVEMDPSLKPQLEMLEKTVIDLEESARDIRAYGERQGGDPRRMEEIESRWELLKNLKRKYGQSVADILEYLSKAEKELSGLSSSDNQLEQLKQEHVKLKKEIGLLALELSSLRCQAAAGLDGEVYRELNELEMTDMQFQVAIERNTSPDGLSDGSGQTFAYTSDGIDDVQFMVSTNPGEPLKPLARIASTGEISRFTLALKGALSGADNIPVLVFDEIDIGVGGRSGDVLGRKLWSLAQTHQVICVTHLPQIAAYAGSHFGVNKRNIDQRTASTLTQLQDNRRIEELALMLSGPGHTDTALKNAEELLKKANVWKGSSSQNNIQPTQLSF
jgi:DNA repair protein RecN (Recombination protein N)